MIRFKKLQEDAVKPTRGTEQSAGIDLYTTGITAITKKTVDYGTGIAVAIPQGYVGLLCVRSSLGANGHSLANNVGIIDADYRGEIIIKLDRDKHEHALLQIKQYDRIAQLVVVPYLDDKISIVKDLDRTKRGKGGFGSTGDK